MTSTIRLLDDITIDKIAAGEVIDNSASIVKELVDNAIDAQATTIRVQIEGGGRQRIIVTDNGVGMVPEDATLAFVRHATSKLRVWEDLYGLYTQGFRGEALAAISAVARVKMTTRPALAERGTLVRVEGGGRVEVGSVCCNTGTMVEVVDLFYNVPVRRKFQKSPAQETQEVYKAMLQLALARPDISFCLVSDQEILLNASVKGADFVEQLKNRVGELLHEEVSTQLLLTKKIEGEWQCTAFIGPPTLHRPNRTGQHLFVNQRPIHCWSIGQAVAQGYGSTLEEKRFPVFVLHLQLPPDEVDVNVHPQKKQVRWRREMELKDFVRRAVAAQVLAPSPQLLSPSASLPWDISSIEYMPQKSTYDPLPVSVGVVDGQLPLCLPQVPKVFACMGPYLVLERSPFAQEEGLYVVDQRRLIARVVMEGAKEAIGKKEGQQLLIPLPLTIPFEERLHWEKAIPILEQHGFSLRSLGPQQWLVEALPHLCHAKKAQELIWILVDAVERDRPIEQVWSEQTFSWAKNPEEGQLLLEQLMRCADPERSPKGEPIGRRISQEDFSRWV